MTDLRSIPTLCDAPPEVEAYQRCEALIRNCGPLMIRAGGGPIQPSLGQHRLMSAKAKRWGKRLRAAGYSYDRIAELTGFSKSCVERNCA